MRIGLQAGAGHTTRSSPTNANGECGIGENGFSPLLAVRSPLTYLCALVLRRCGRGDGD